MNKAKLEILDEVNVRLRDIDIKTIRKIRDKLKFFIPAARYTPAFKAGWWDGNEYLCDLGGRTYLNLLDVILPIIINEGYDLDIDDQRKNESITFNPIDNNYFSDRTWPKGHKLEFQPIELLEHQVTCINLFLKDRTAIQEIPTSGGKTLIFGALASCIEKQIDGNTIVIVPNKTLVRQTEEDFKMLGLDVGVYFGDRKETGHKHLICTWQILNILGKKGKKEEKEKKILLNLLHNVKGILVDEAHGIAAKALKNLLSAELAHAPVRWALTGTIPKDQHQYYILLSMIGPVIDSITPKELQDKGVLAKCHIHIKQLKEILEFQTFHEEYEYIVTKSKNLQYLAKLAIDLSATGNTLILVNRIETGQKLEEILNCLGIKADFLSGQMNVEDRKEHYNELTTGDDGIKIATYGIAAVGVNVPRIFHLMLYEPGKSFIKVIQSIGRGLRVAKDKDYVDIYDISSSSKFSKRHLAERKKFYKEKEYPFDIEKIELE